MGVLIVFINLYLKQPLFYLLYNKSIKFIVITLFVGLTGSEQLKS